MRPIRNELVSRCLSAATKNPLPLGMGSVKEAEALRNAIELSNFLSDVKTWNEEDMNELIEKRNTLGLTKSVKSQLYDAYFDICYYGSTDKASFMQMFNLSDEQLGGILL